MDRLGSPPPRRPDGGQDAIDPSRRVFVPIERRMSDGRWIFRTTDRESYTRDARGVIRRTRPKTRGKAARKADREVRRRTKLDAGAV